MLQVSGKKMDSVSFVKAKVFALRIVKRYGYLAETKQACAPVFFVALSFTLLAVGVENLPASEFADTEVPTNLPFVVSFDAMSRLEFTLSLDASPTNCVEVSIGTDTNADGALSLDESDYTLGYRCGRWFQRDALADSETETPETRTGRLERMFTLRKRKLNPAWDLVKVTRRGVTEIGEVVLVEGKKPGAALTVR